MHISKRILLVLIVLLSVPFGIFAQWNVTGGLYTPYEYTPPSSSGLSAVMLVYGTSNLSLRYQTSALQPQTVAFEQHGNTVLFENPESGYGYFIEQNDRIISYIWLIDYEPLKLEMSQLSVDDELSDCNQVRLSFAHSAPNLSYNSINGRSYVIDRMYTVKWQSLQWNDDSKQFIISEVQETVKDSKDIPLTAPLCDTQFELTGDQFLSFWGIARQVSTPLYQAVAVDCKAFAEQHVRDAGNELEKENSELGGSAPVNISFTGYANCPVTTYQAWEISRNADFEVLEATYTDQNLDYSFEEEGTLYVRYVVSNAQGSCSQIAGPFKINVSESSLQVPNVFTPDSENGNNQVFKVAYKSIVKFEAQIFNRWGNLLYKWNDPSQGWDGKYHGKIVPTGAYYYVIKAEGAGGKKYRLKGDINVLRTRN